MKKTNSLLQILLIAVALVSCVKKRNFDDPNMSAFPALKDIKIDDASLAQLDPAKVSIYNKLRSVEKISYFSITSLWTMDQIDNYNDVRGTSFTLSDLHNFMNEAMTHEEAVANNPDPAAFKDVYERGIELYQGQEIAYDRLSVSVPFLPEDNSMQCYSGTIFHQLMSRRLDRNAFISNNPVIIFSPGHVLPGYVKRDSDGDWNLFGVETTLAGKGRILFGKTKELDHEIRVVDAEYYAVIELFKFARISNSQEIITSILKYTAEKYDIPLQNIENLISQLQISNQSNTASGLLSSMALNFNAGSMNQTIFAFGSNDNNPNGRRQRQVADEAKYSKTRGGYVISSGQGAQNSTSSISSTNSNSSVLTVAAGSVNTLPPFDPSQRRTRAQRAAEEAEKAELMRKNYGSLESVPRDEAGYLEWWSNKEKQLVELSYNLYLDPNRITDAFSRQYMAQPWSEQSWEQNFYGNIKNYWGRGCFYGEYKEYDVHSGGTFKPENYSLSSECTYNFSTSYLNRSHLQNPSSLLKSTVMRTFDICAQIFDSSRSFESLNEFWSHVVNVGYKSFSDLDKEHIRNTCGPILFEYSDVEAMVNSLFYYSRINLEEYYKSVRAQKDKKKSEKSSSNELVGENVDEYSSEVIYEKAKSVSATVIPKGDKSSNKKDGNDIKK